MFYLVPDTRPQSVDHKVMDFFLISQLELDLFWFLWQKLSHLFQLKFRSQISLLILGEFKAK